MTRLEVSSRGVGVLALQGAFDLHATAVGALGRPSVLVRRAADLDGLDALVLPGGESTVQLNLLGRFGLEEPLRRFALSGRPIFATCAGVILLARAVRRPEQRSLGLMDIVVKRNAWGRQVESFEAISDRGRDLVFIRAPRIVEIGKGVEVLDTFEGEPVLVRERNITCATFHPELASGGDVHREALRLR